MADLTRDDVAHLAGLARIDLSDAELDRMVGELGVILEAVATVQQAPIADVEPMSHPMPIVNVTRPDVVRPSLTPEAALSGAILTVDLEAIGSSTYDLPTLDDENRAGEHDAADPFGGNDGKNQARLVPGGPVQLYAPGFRNPYDLVVTQSGRLYTIDNGGNAGWTRCCA